MDFFSLSASNTPLVRACSSDFTPLQENKEASDLVRGPDRTVGGFFNDIWNSDFVRDFTGDFLSLSLDTDLFFLKGFSIQQLAYVVPLRGKDAFNVVNTQSVSNGHGLDISISGNFTKLRYEGPVNSPRLGLSAQTLSGGFDDVNFGLNIGGVELSVGEIRSHANEAGFKVHGRLVGLGGGPPIGAIFSYNSSFGGQTVVR